MSTEAELQQAYAEWRRLAEAEGNAIRAGNWPFVAECQKALSLLPAIIDRLTEHSRQQTQLPRADGTPRKAICGATILELMELQRRNLAALHQRRQNLAAHIQQVSRTSQNLRAIQRSYATPKASGWSSYS